MLSIEEISARLNDLPTAVGDQWHLYPLVPTRIFLSRGHDASFTVFVEGDANSFGQLPLLRGIEHREDAKDVESGRIFGALRLTAPPTPHGSQALEFIAYELMRSVDADPGISNASLISRVGWILQLLGAEPELLSPERQRGLVAECLFLRRLLQIGRLHGIAVRTVLDRWWGPSGGKRDFAAIGVAVEVKSTALNSRIHHISSIDQLEPLSPGELAYLCSVGIKSEPTADRKLPHYIADVMSELVQADGTLDVEAAYAFNTKLASAGYSETLNHLYNSSHGLLPNPALPLRLYRVEDLERIQISSFKGDKLPSMVTAVSYEIDVSARPLNEVEAEAVMYSLINSPGL